jgi:hypothetical protein
LKFVNKDSIPLRERVFEMVARRGRYLAVEDLDEFSAEEWEALAGYLSESRPDLATRISEAMSGGDAVLVYSLEIELCGWLNIEFDRESVRRMYALPEEERDAVRAQPVKLETWKQLRGRARWHTTHPHRRDLGCPIAPRHGRRGRQTRHARRQSVRTRPAAARAPGRRSSDDEPSPRPELVHPPYARSSA